MNDHGDEGKQPASGRVELKAGPSSGHLGFQGGNAQLTILTYPETLLRTAERLKNEGQHGIAVVVAHMACEIATERALGEAFRARNITDLEVAIEDFLSGYNLGNDRIRNLYVAMTKDAIHEQSFWPAFKESANRRNRIMHAGEIISKSEAEQSLEATSKLVEHLMSRPA